MDLGAPPFFCVAFSLPFPFVLIERIRNSAAATHGRSGCGLEQQGGESAARVFFDAWFFPRVGASPLSLPPTIRPYPPPTGAHSTTYQKKIHKSPLTSESESEKKKIPPEKKKRVVGSAARGSRTERKKKKKGCRSLLSSLHL